MAWEIYKKAYRLVIILVCMIGLMIKTGLYQGVFKEYTLIYYTNLSNALVMVTFMIAVFGRGMQYKHWFIRLKGGVMQAIMMTGIIYHFILLPNYPDFWGISWVDSLGNILLHYISPILVVLDWILWDKKGVFLRKDSFFWILIPYSYFFGTVIQVAMGNIIPNQKSKYPYDFIAIDIHGWEYVIKNVLIISVFYVLASFLLIAVDKAMKRHFLWNQ